MRGKKIKESCQLSNVGERIFISVKLDNGNGREL